MKYYSKQVVGSVVVSVESKTVKALSPGFVEATKTEYDTFIASLPVHELKISEVFIPLNPSMSIAARVTHIEEFLTGVIK